MTARVRAVAAEEKATAPTRAVEVSLDGAKWLASTFWQEIEATTRGAVRVRQHSCGVELRLVGRGPVLIRLGRPRHVVRPGLVSCSYPILGGLLVGRPGGALAFEQVEGRTVVLRSTLTEYVPRLAGRRYAFVQARVHAAISRRHLARVIRGAT